MKRARQGGFLLVELLIGLALTALLLQALFPLLFTSILSWNSSVARMSAHQSARMALEGMTRELRVATAVLSPLPGGRAAGIRFTLIDHNGKVQTLIFQRGLPSGGNAQTLYRINSPGQPTPLTEDVVSDIAFYFQPPRLVRISLTVTDAKTNSSDTVETGIICTNIPD
jgi:type II secretory pathway pseudopilin PulG